MYIVEYPPEMTVKFYFYFVIIQVRTIHLNARTSSMYRALRSRGVEQRNTGLSWIREYCHSPEKELACQRGVLYFMDDDNKYDIRLFEEVR